MGLQLDLVATMHLPMTTVCSKCFKDTHTGFDDYDIECDAPKVEARGNWSLTVYCEECQKPFKMKFKTVPITD